MAFDSIATRMDYCRACMISENRNQLIFLYRNNINIIYSECTSLVINESDNLPSYICHKCNQQLDQFNEFRKQCLTSETTFKEKIKIEKTENSEETDAGDRLSIIQPMVVFEQYIGIDSKENLKRNSIKNTADVPVTDFIKAELKSSISDYEFSDNNSNSDATYGDSNDDSIVIPIKKIKRKVKTKKPSINKKSPGKQTVLTCDMCEKTFLEKHRLVGHLREHVGLKPFECDTCEKTYNQYSTLLKHQKLEHPTDENTKIKQHICGYEGCNKAFDFKYALSIHVDSEHKNADPKSAEQKNRANEKYVCEICNKVTYRKHQMEAHLRAAHQGKKKAYVCDVCGKEYLSYRSLSEHTERRHAVFEKLKCDYEGCDKVYSLLRSLRAHKRVAHMGFAKPPRERRFVCEQCGKSFTAACSLRSHVFVHTGERPFACEICPKRFATRNSLTEHIRRHLKIKTHECPICGEKKTTSSELKVHINYHTLEKKFPCNMCSMIFNRMGSKNRHMSIVHLGVKAHKCTYCGRAFSKLQSLRNHILIHTGEKPHPCPICGTRFRQAIAMKTHLKVHNKVKV